MKRDNLRTGAIISGFLLAIILVITVFCLTFCNRKTTIDSSSSMIGVEEIVTTIETSTDVSTETTTSVVDKTTTTTLVESTTTTETTTVTSQEQTSATSQTFTTASPIKVTEIVSLQPINNTTLSVTPICAETTTTVTVLKSNEEIIKEIYLGQWGNGEERKNRLEAAGYNYDEIQSLIVSIENTLSELQLNIQFEKTFNTGTYYAYGGPRKGGSGRQLIDCSQGDGMIKGSIASRYLYEKYGYNYNNKRTMVYLEIADYPSMNGLYYLDDSNAAGYNDVIDFFYLQNCNCPFQYQGVVKVDCYIIK